LNPLELEIKCVKNLPAKINLETSEVYAQYTFLDHTQKTQVHPHQNYIKFNDKHVFLTGLYDQVKLKEELNNH